MKLDKEKFKEGQEIEIITLPDGKNIIADINTKITVKVDGEDVFFCVCEEFKYEDVKYIGIF